MGRVKTLKRREEAVRLKEKRQKAEGAPPEVRFQDEQLAKAREEGWRLGFYDAAKTCVNVAKESSNIKRAREGLASVAHNAKRGAEAIGVE